ncbi:hypothetical protein CB0940_10890 [Cercospora beticola]|uniref:Xylanolytic transcriptional activator regulatory domain-containing protein n=1 Tax=Cercospora beticola TaxID=122368 RepID=A0A2G5HEN7_CERBT|nr:hypothetical protein CB0940_10890 [Cercospora beticola]PIA90989.1 hypothetical protein CB0940_10890 [Cercospora beticola]WPB07774.1 hypothetical protein RHO25_012438 [Cercospora beticola]
MTDATPTARNADPTSTSIFQEYGEAVIEDMLGSYLTLIHDRPHSLFHVSSLWTSVRQRSISSALLLNLCALGSRLSSKPHIREMAATVTVRAKRVLQGQIEQIRIENVQAYILLANIYAAELAPHLETLYFGIANRMAQILGLHRPDPSLGLIQRETNCRIWWTLVMADNWCSAGLGIPRQLTPTEPTDMPLPFDEFTFQRLELGEPPLPATALKEGLWAHMIRLVDLLGPIHQLNRLVAGHSIDAEEADRRVAHIARQLDDWPATLPPGTTESHANMESHKSRDLGGPFVSLHLGYHHYSTLLYFRYLGTSSTTSTVAHAYARSCRQHASSYSQLLRKSRETTGYEVIFPTIAHLTVVSSSVHLHTLLFGRDDELKQARADLLSNFAALIDMRKYWPCLDHIMKRLLLFQEACLQSDTSATHRVDQWMVKFLTEHSLPLERRVEQAQISQISTPSQWSDSSQAPHSPRTREWMANQALSTLWHVD